MKSELKKWYFKICKSIVDDVYEYRNIYERIDKIKNKSRTRNIDVLIYDFDAEANEKYKIYWKYLLATTCDCVYYKIKGSNNPLYGGFFYIKSAISDGNRIIKISYHINPDHRIYKDMSCSIM